ncbi:MAG: glycosyltransferase family 1 protein [Gemmatimonadales bacterium]
MRIGIDLTALVARPTGVDTYLVEFVSHLVEIDRSNQYTLFLNFADRRRFNGTLGPNIRIRVLSGRQRAVRFAFQQIALPLASAANGFDVIHSPSFLLPFWKGRARHLLTVHDMTFFTMPAVHTRLHRSAAFRSAVLASIRRADMINVPSEAARIDLLRLLPGISADVVRVTRFGVHPRFCVAPAAEVARHLARLELPQRYVLSLGTIEPRKNQIAVIEAFRRLVSAGDTGLHLVFAGQGSRTREIMHEAQSPALRGRVHFLGYVPDEALPWLYRGASLFVYPSLDEGFGFPPLEAMACGAPVIASLGSSLEENLAGAAELVSPTDAVALGDAMRRLLTDHNSRQLLVQRGLQRAATFRWEQTARQILDCYQDLAAS